MAKRPLEAPNDLESVFLRILKRTQKKYFTVPLKEVEKLQDDIEKRMMLSCLLTRGIDDDFATAYWVFGVPNRAVDELLKCYEEIDRLELELTREKPRRVVKNRAKDFTASKNLILDDYLALVKFAIQMSGYYTLGAAGGEFMQSIGRDLFPLLRKHGVLKRTPEVKFWMKLRPDLSIKELKKHFGEIAVKEAKRGRRKSRRQQWPSEFSLGKKDRDYLTEGKPTY